MYATSPGQAAADGRGRNGVFTGALLEHIATPGIDAMSMLLEVRRDVMAATGGEQTPWENSSLTDRFYFAGAPAGAVASPETTQPTGPRLQVVPTYGEKQISVATAGDLYLDGELIGRLDAGQAARLQDVPTGSRELAMDYGEERERVTVTVRSGITATAPFEYQPAPAEPELSLDTVVVEGGTFQMGSASGGVSNELPVHTVTLDVFRMSSTEVTFAQYDVFARAIGRDLPDDEGWGRGDRPVINVSWDRSANGWRVPTEAEWEYAARGGQQARDTTYAGSDSVEAVAWYGGNSDSRTHPVGQKHSNELGLYDMSGNVWEWCWDWYDGVYYIREATELFRHPSLQSEPGSWD